MKKNIVSLLVFVALITLACQTTGLSVTPTPTVTATSQPTETPTKRPTNTPLPTETPLPTPAPVGSVVTYKTLEINIVDFATHGLIYPGGYSAWYPKDKNADIFLDVGVYVKNTGPSIGMFLKYIGIVEENGDAWYPIFANFKNVDDGKTIDPFGISIPENASNGTDTIFFNGNTFMRLIFIVKKGTGNTILFNIEDSPFISFDLE